MPRTTRRHTSVRVIDPADRVWCRVERRSVRAERCLGCERLSSVVARGDEVYIACRSDREEVSAPGR